MQTPHEALGEELGLFALSLRRELRDGRDLALAEVRAELASLKQQASELRLVVAGLEQQAKDRIASLHDGSDGERGIQGERGEAGTAGEVGPPGASGERGVDGLPGVPGERGPAGDQGEKGDAGEAGERGLDGTNGTQGPMGERGSDGAPGERGEPGERGDPGDPGIIGDKGDVGPQGERGEPGEKGDTGERGLVGEKGERGEAGAQGERGADGVDGLQGVAGEKGERGVEGPAGKLPIVKEWSEGIHYETVVVSHNGSTFQALRDTAREPPHEDWRCIAIAGRNGADGHSFNVRGTWNAKTLYTYMDMVALGGASFVAKRDDPGSCPGDGWQLSASQGKRGNPGERGPAGERGLPGSPAVALTIESEGLLTLTNADGSVVTCDLYPVLSRVLR